jgi:ribose 5-phosphate isomerase A
VVPFGWTRVSGALQALGSRPIQRMSGAKPFVTDGGHYILDCWFDHSLDLRAMAGPIKSLTGVVDHGVFLGMVSTVLVGHPDGVETRQRP